MKSSIKEKADIKSVVQVIDKLKHYAQLKDLKELYEKVVPQLAEFEKSMQDFVTDNLQFKQMITRYDEVMAQKANKTSLIGLEKKCKEKFARKN